jgi:DNA polymerase-1
METVFGWPLLTVGGDNPRSLANFPAQGNGAEMMRLACSLVTEAGIAVCCPVHDALLIEADEAHIDDVVVEAQGLMRQAGRVVLDGFDIESDAKIYRHPERYSDEERGAVMWQKVVHLAQQADSEVYENVS